MYNLKNFLWDDTPDPYFKGRVRGPEGRKGGREGKATRGKKG